MSLPGPRLVLSVFGPVGSDVNTPNLVRFIEKVFDLIIVADSGPDVLFDAPLPQEFLLFVG